MPLNRRSTALPRGFWARWFSPISPMYLAAFGVYMMKNSYDESQMSLAYAGAVLTLVTTIGMSWTVRVSPTRVTSGPLGLPLLKWRTADINSVVVGTLPVRGRPHCVELRLNDRRRAVKFWSSVALGKDRRTVWVARIRECAGMAPLLARERPHLTTRSTRIAPKFLQTSPRRES